MGTFVENYPHFIGYIIFALKFNRLSNHMFRYYLTYYCCDYNLITNVEIILKAKQSRIVTD